MITIISITVAYLIGLGYTIQSRICPPHDKDGVEPYYITIITFIISPILILVKIGADISLQNNSK